MRFGPVPLEQAEGKILGHNVAGLDGRRVLRKGRPLTAKDVAKLSALGRKSVYVAELEPGDIDENAAARRLATAAMGQGLRLSGPSTGRANLFAVAVGVLRVAAGRLERINAQEGITVATLSRNSAVSPGKMVATVKILPYALPEATVSRVESVAGEGGPLIGVDKLVPQNVGLILSGSLSTREQIVYGFSSALEQRLGALNATIKVVDFVPLEDETSERVLADQIKAHVTAGMQLVILAGETAIMDRYDMAPRAVERAGGEVTCYGAPVDPGNLLMVGYLDSVAIMGAPGCARSPKANIVDLVIPRLLAGDRLTRADIVAYGHGGLLEDVPERPMPRSRLS